MSQGNLFGDRWQRMRSSVEELVERELVVEDPQRLVSREELYDALKQARSVDGKQYSKGLIKLLEGSVAQFSDRRRDDLRRVDYAGVFVTAKPLFGSREAMAAWRGRHGVRAFGESQYSLLTRYVARVSSRQRL